MQFKGRQLKSYAEFVLASELKEGQVYFCVRYCDEEMLIPKMEPLVFIGLNLEPGDVGRAYFQDLDSYEQGIRHDSSNPEAEDALFQSFQETPSGHVGAILEFEPALECLMSCSLRRKRAAHDAN